MPCKEGQFDVVELMVNDQFKTFSINLNAQHVNGMTHNVREKEEADLFGISKVSIGRVS